MEMKNNKYIKGQLNYYIRFPLMVTTVGKGAIRATYHLLEMHNTVKDIINSP